MLQLSDGVEYRTSLKHYFTDSAFFFFPQQRKPFFPSKDSSKFHFQTVLCTKFFVLPYFGINHKQISQVLCIFFISWKKVRFIFENVILGGSSSNGLNNRLSLSHPVLGTGQDLRSWNLFLAFLLFPCVTLGKTLHLS